MPLVAPPTLQTLRAHLPRTARACVRAIVEQVPGYAREFDSRLLVNIESAVQMALSAFLDSLEGEGAQQSLVAMRAGAYRLGQGEAETGRSTDALLSAYRVGAREAWTQIAACALDHGESAGTMSALAAETFTFIDDLSAQSLAGHTAAMTARTRELSRRRDELGAALVAGEARGTLEHLCERAHWNAPRTLTALLVVGDVPARTHAGVHENTLWARTQDGAALALIPDLTRTSRSRLLAACPPERTALGPTLPWETVHESVIRARRALRFAGAADAADSEALLPELLLAADPIVRDRLRERAVEPLSDISAAKRAILTETMLSWLLHQGRRDEVASALHVHPQTVRYRMNTARELYGDRLNDPRESLELILGLLAEQTPEEDGS